MARSAAEVQEAPKKKKAYDEKSYDAMLQQINGIIDLAIKRGKTFPATAEELRDLEAKGSKSREERKIREMTPTPTEQKSPLVKAVPTKEMKMTRPAEVAALALEENLNGASGPSALNLGKWAKGGRQAYDSA
jgi:hypothetical protein